MKRSWPRMSAMAAVMVGAGVVVSSCGLAAPNNSEAASRDRTVVVGTRLVAETLDPLQASNANNDFYNTPVYDRLVRYDSSGKLVPQLAAEWKLSADATELNVTLRDDVVFHSGNKLTAADIVYTLDRAKKVGSGSAAFIADYASAEAVDGTHVRVKLSRPSLDFVGALSLIYIIDSKLVAGHEGKDDAQQWLANNDAGSGPYLMTGYTPSQQVQLKRNDKYWAPDAKRPDNVVLRIITDPGAIRDELRSGGIDIGYTPPAADMPSFRNGSDFHVIGMPAPRQLYVMMNTEGKVTGDPRVREAIQLAYDYSGHIRTALNGQGKIATGLLPPISPCRVDAGESKQDLQRARELIRQAGAEGKSVSLAYQAVIPEHNMAGTLLESSLREIGLNAQIKTVTFPQYMEMASSPKTTPDLAIAFDFAAYPAAGSMLDRAWNSKNVNRTNFARYANPKVDQLLERGLNATDPEAACTDFKAAQDLILKDRPALLVSNPLVEIVANNKVGNIEYSPTSQVFDLGLLELK